MSFKIPMKGGRNDATGIVKSILVLSIIFVSLFLITSAMGVHYTYSNQYNGGYSSCQSCGMLSSDQFTYGTNAGTWYVAPYSSFPIQLKVNDMLDEKQIDDVYSKYRVILREKNTGVFIKDFSGNFPTAGFMESDYIYYNYYVSKEAPVEAEVYLSRDGGISWEESYYYLLGKRPVWTFIFQATTVSDIDKDGKPDDQDNCPNVAGPVSNYGCPLPTPSTPTTTTTTTTTTVTPTQTATPAGTSSPPAGDTNTTVVPVVQPTTTAPTGTTPTTTTPVATDPISRLLTTFDNVIKVVMFFVDLINFGIMFPFIALTNTYHALTQILCIGSYSFFGNTLPLFVLGFFLLMMLVPDDVIGLVMSAVLVYFLGTTAPAIAITSVPALATLSLVVPASIAQGSVFASKSLGPGAIIIGFVILALYQIFTGQAGTARTRITSNGKTSDVTASLDASNSLKQLRTLLAEGTLILILAMYAECKLGLPIYSGIISFIEMLPRALTQIAEVLF